jgi:hypothetical protein
MGLFFAQQKIFNNYLSDVRFGIKEFKEQILQGLSRIGVSFFYFWVDDNSPARDCFDVFKGNRGVSRCLATTAGLVSVAAFHVWLVVKKHARPGKMTAPNCATNVMTWLEWRTNTMTATIMPISTPSAPIV